MIDINNVSYTYEGQNRPTLNKISLHIKTGECVLLCGKSGCGKTSVTRLINGIIPFFHEGRLEGNVTVDGKAMEEQELYQVSGSVGSVFQNPRTQFYTVNTTSEIAFGCENMGMKPDEIRSRISKTAKGLDIENLLNRNIFQLSGGEKQIIAFASVYAMNPDIYVLDEPSSNLDKTAVFRIKEIIKLLKSQGKTIVIAEHRIYYLRDIVDRAVYMEDGEIVSEYTMEQLSGFSDQQRLDTGIRNTGFPEYKVLSIPAGSKSSRMNIRNLTCRYGKETVLNILDITIKSGEIIAVIGSNGAGKSTFVSSLCGLMKKQKGTVFVDDKPVGKKERLRSGYMVLQEVNHQLFTGSVCEEVILGAQRADIDQLNQILELLNLKGLEDCHPMTLSGGQKQRVAIAAAMFCGKRLLVFDEPTSGLDFTHMIKTGQLLSSLKEMGVFVFVITHDFEFIIECCDSVIHIEKGVIQRNYSLDKTGYERVKDFF